MSVDTGGAPIAGALRPEREVGRNPGCEQRLTPLLDPWIARFLESGRETLAALVDRYGSPLNIVWPHTVAGNIDAMVNTLAMHRVDYEIYYGAKVNKSRALVRAAVEAGVGIDVSSLAEFEDALRAGAAAARICATGPAKTATFHRELVAANALVAVDSLEELHDLESCLLPQQHARVLLRFRPLSEAKSRFGMGYEAIVLGLQHLARSGDRFVFEGFHAHLGSYAVETRIAAMPELAELVDIARDLGLAPRMIDIGGGMPIRYVAPDVYADVLRDQRPEDYQNARVPDDFYPYGSRQTAEEWLAAFLSAPCRDGTIATYLRDAGLHLAIEPGRSLVDQGAISVFRVIRVKSLGDKTAVIFVEGSSFSACETWFNSEFLIDPIWLPMSSRQPGSGAIRAYIAGHSCLDGDVVTNRLLSFPALPQAGDLLIYANTAGYQMDLLENEFHRHPMPARLVASLSASGEFSFATDK